MSARVPFFDLKQQYQAIREEMDREFAEVFAGGQFIGGDFIKAFEQEWANALNVSHCVALGNGTDALFVALKTLKLAPGDEVITPAWSWISSSETISLAGGKPVFADADEFFTVNVEELKKKRSHKTRGVVVVHLYGQPAGIDAIAEWCRQNGLFLIEDCAQAHLTTLHGKPVGTWGDMGTFSFYPTKNLGAYGDAGAVVAQRAELAEYARRFANHGGLSKDDHPMEGMNSRMDVLQAVALRVKLKYVAGWNDKRRTNAALYHELLGNVPQIVLPKIRQGAVHTFHVYAIRAQNRNELKDYLQQQGIETQIHYPKALPFDPAYQQMGHIPSDFPMAARFQNEVLSLPVYPELTEEQIYFVSKQIKNFYSP